MAVVSRIVGIVDSIAPSYLKLEYDKIGLQVGSFDAPVDKVLVTLELTREVIEEARDKGAQLILSHHPLIFKSLERVLADDTIGGLVTDLIKSDIALLVAHTNLDRASDGVSDVLARMLDLKDIEVMLPARDVQMFKLMVFVPTEVIDDMISALGNAGAGIIGKYSHSTFRTRGVGTFYPMPGAQPYLGDIGRLNQVDEYRLEALVSPDKLSGVIKTMLSAHPYKEVAYDVYEVKNPPAGVGLGRVGNTSEPRKLRDYVELWSEKLGSVLKVAGDLDRVIDRVAVCGGSGGELIGAAKAAGADVFVTGDIKHHAAHNALAMGLALIDAGHAETERLVVPEVARELRERLAASDLRVDVILSEINTSPWNRG